MRLLLVEDNERLSEFVARGLMAAGFTVDHVTLADEALSACSTTKYDVVILDLGLPDGDGMIVLRQLRQGGNHTPVLIMTARDALADRVAGLNAGADDYVLKPFELDEMVARLKALLRRPDGALGVSLELGNLRFDTASRTVEVAAAPLVLSRRELMLLELLLRRAGHVVGKDSLEEGLYGHDEPVSSNPLEAVVSRLRRKLSAVGAGVEIHTVRGVGYLATEAA